MEKFFTIVIPTYNSKRLKPGLDSIESQSHKELLEVIIVDDNSSDKSHLELLKHYTFDYKIIENTINFGPGGARQVGLDAARGKWVTFLDHDDEFNPDCFHLIKQEIENSKCEAMFDTQIIVAEDENWILSGNYVVTSEDCWLHGRFFNRNFLTKNGIRFHTKIFAQEDIYFCSLVTGILMIDPKYREYGAAASPLVTYYWYLWEDSTSHKKEKDRSYIVNHFDDYITSNYDGYKFIYSLYPDETLKEIKLTSCLMYCYLFYEKFSFAYRNTGQDISDILYHTKRYKDILLKEMNITNDKLIQLMNDDMRAEMYYMFIKKVNECLDGFFIPQRTITDFILLLDNYDK